MSIRPTRLHLGNLSIKVSSDDIERFFHGYGRIVQIVLKRGYAFVELDNEKDADDAVRDLHGRQMDGMT
jgi:arginine/serine-rich splicing factor 4/5/6